MRLPKAPQRRETAARRASRAAGKIRYPLGKALARIHYFEAQRGVQLTRYDSGRVSTGTADATRSRDRSRPSTARVRAPAVPYAAAAAAKVRLGPPKFAAARKLP